jgi:hypothetical protein
LYESDFKISQIAKLSKEAISSFAHIDHSNSKSTEAYILQLINAILEYDTLDFEKTFKAGIKQYGFEKAITEIGYGLLKRIGLLWLTDHLIPAQEHFASSLIKNMLINAIENLPKVNTNTTEEILLFTPVGEFHEIPLLFAHWLFKKNGIKTCFLGTNISTEEIKICLRKIKITHLYFHLITNLTGKTLLDYTGDLLKKFPDQNLIVSCPKAKNLNILSPNLIILKSLEEMMAFPVEFMSQELHN